MLLLPCPVALPLFLPLLRSLSLLPCRFIVFSLCVSLSVVLLLVACLLQVDRPRIEYTSHRARLLPFARPIKTMYTSSLRIHSAHPSRLLPLPLPLSIRIVYEYLLSSVSVAIGAYACCFAVFALSHTSVAIGFLGRVLRVCCCVRSSAGGRPLRGPCQLRAKVERNRTKDTASAAEGRRLLAAAAAAVGHRRLAGRSPSVWPYRPVSSGACDQRGSAIEPD